MANTTKQWIALQMKELMRQKPLSKISVTEICRAAGIERPTFYYHFKDKYELVAWVFFHTAETENIIDLPSAVEGLSRLKSELAFFRQAYADISQNALWTYIVEYYTEAYSALAKEILHTDQLDPSLLYSIRFFCYGTVGMAREWITTDDKTPAEEFARRMFLSMSAEMFRIFFPSGLPEYQDQQI